ncbi:MAG: 2-phospho-L-lactate transferase CofD family protein, partial [Chloroflexia bacterium]
MQQKKIVVIGGGAGTDMLLAGLKRYTSKLSALISPFDAASAQWPVVSDHYVSSLLALGADPSTTRLMERLFDYHLTREQGSQAGPDSFQSTFGNLFLSALTGITGTPDQALQAAAQVLNVRGQVLPITLHECPLVAELGDGSEAMVTTPVGLIATSAKTGLRGIRLARPTPLLEAAADAIIQADVVVLGPADFYFHVLAPFLLDGMAEALAASSAVKVFVCNLLTQPNTTAGWPASHFARQLISGGRGSGVGGRALLTTPDARTG